jgi:hypothetical protein
MKRQTLAQAKIARKLSSTVIAKLYLDLQGLRDKVQKAEMSCAPKGSKKLRLAN